MSVERIPRRVQYQLEAARAVKHAGRLFRLARTEEEAGGLLQLSQGLLPLLKAGGIVIRRGRHLPGRLFGVRRVKRPRARNQTKHYSRQQEAAQRCRSTHSPKRCRYFSHESQTH